MGEGKRRVPGVIVHRRTVLTTHDRRARHGIPVTSPVRTLADLAIRLSDVELESATHEADRLELIEPERLRRMLSAIRGEAGVARVTQLLDRQLFRTTDSELERMFLRLVRKARWPLPQTQVVLNGFRVDFYWPDLGLVVETDGLRYHRTPGQQVRDRRRDQVHAMAGLTTLRFTHAQVRFECDQVIEVLTRVIARLARRPAA
jgi:very-short-patch-repair endonuclease